MTVATSVWNRAVRALRDQLAAQPGYRLPTSTAVGGITVYAGPPANTADPGDYVAFGFVDDTTDAGDFTQRSAALATTRPREEEAQIRCVASSSGGDRDPLVVLDAAWAAMAGVEDLIRTVDPTLGLQGAGGGQLQQFIAQFRGNGRVRWPKTTRGVRCDVEFTITYKARL